MIRVSLLIFDLDGTLINTLDDIAGSVNYALTRLGREPIPKETVCRYVGDGIALLLTRSLGGDTALLTEAVAFYKEHHRRNLTAHSSLYPGVRETLEYFRSIPLAVVTNKATEFVLPVLERLGIARYFRTAIGADSGLSLKPAPDMIVRAIGQFGASKGRTAVVGDGTTDIQAGRAAGAITCAVTYGFRSENELRKANPDHVIHRLPELNTLFEPIPGR